MIILQPALIATFLIHSKLDYSNSLLLNLPSTQTKHLQLVLNAAARAVTKTPNFHHISPILKTLHRLKINERIQYKVLSPIKLFLSGHPSYLHSLLSLKRNCSTRSSSVVTLNRPSNNSRLKITNRSFHLTAPALWNSLPPDLHHLSSHSTSQPNLKSPVFSLSPVFLKNSKLIFFTFRFLLSLTV